MTFSPAAKKHADSIVIDDSYSVWSTLARAFDAALATVAPAQPRVLTTAAELDALQIGQVLRDAKSDVWRKDARDLYLKTGCKARGEVTTDKCRPVDVDLDGEQVTVRVHGSGGEWTDEDRAALAEIVKAAIRKLEQDQLAAEREADGLCVLCGFPMDPAEAMFRYHGSLGPCPTSGADS